MNKATGIKKRFRQIAANDNFSSEPLGFLVAGAGFIRAYGHHPFGAAASGVLRTSGPCEPAFLISS